MKLEITLKQCQEVVEESKEFKMELLIEECTVIVTYDEGNGLDWYITQGEWKLEDPFEEYYELSMLVEECDKIYLILE